MQFQGCIDKVEDLWTLQPGSHLLPRVTAILSNGEREVKVTGWFPIHHRNVVYTLLLNATQNDACFIKSIERVERKPLKDSSSIPKTDKLFKRCMKTAMFHTYTKLTEQAYSSGPLWRLCTLYSYWDLLKMNIVEADAAISNNLLALCDRESPICHRDVLYNSVKAKELVEKAALLYDTPPSSVDGLIWWQKQTRSDTAMFARPDNAIHDVQYYQGKWTSRSEIERAGVIKRAFGQASVLVGSPCPSNIPENAVVWVRSIEDAYRWKCWVDWGRLYVLNESDGQYLGRVGLQRVQKICTCTEPVYIAWAHLWAVEEWVTIAPYVSGKVTCIGRLDQYPRGRGQVFRDLVSTRDEIVQTFHRGCENVIQTTTENVCGFIATICKEHSIVQCFADDPNKWKDIDTGRLWLSQPRRIRTTCERNSSQQVIKVFEEAPSIKTYKGRNASVIRAGSFEGLPIPVSVYICGPETKSFDVHVARTHTRDLFIILNCTTCLFSFEHQTPRRVTINCFI